MNQNLTPREQAVWDQVTKWQSANSDESLNEACKAIGKQWGKSDQTIYTQYKAAKDKLLKRKHKTKSKTKVKRKSPKPTHQTIIVEESPATHHTGHVLIAIVPVSELSNFIRGHI